MKLYVVMYLDYYSTSGFSDGGILGVFDTWEQAEEVYNSSYYGKQLRIIETELNQTED